MKWPLLTWGTNNLTGLVHHLHAELLCCQQDHFLVFACSYSWPKWASTFNVWTVNCFALGHLIKGICSKASAWQQGLLLLRQMGKAGWSDCKSYHNSYLLGIALYYAFLSVDKSSSRHDRCTWESDVLPMLKSCFPCQSWIGRSKWLINKKMLVDKTGESFAKPHHLQLPCGSQQQIWRMAISLRAHSWDGECRCNTRDLVEWKGG